MQRPAQSGLRPLTRLAVALSLLSPLAFAVPQLRTEEALPTTTPDADAEAVRTIDATRPILGYAIVAHHIGNLDLYLESVDRIAALGANALTIVTPLFQEKVDSTDVRVLEHKCPTEEQLLAIFERAKGHGLLTQLQPIVLIEDPGEKDWRGVIRPTDWDAWWASYDRLIERNLRIARAAKVDVFVIGSELNTTEDQLDRWRRVVNTVRSSFPGQITYSANWDRYTKTDIWEMVDAISVSSYFELERNRPGAPTEDLVAAWGPVQRLLLRFAEGWGKPLVLSELGYPSLPWANAHPWNYVAKGKKADHELQARCFEAFFEAWSDDFADTDGPAAGFYCYHWDPYHQGRPKDTGYGVQGKPAKAVIEQGFAEIKRRVLDPRPATRPARDEVNATQPTSRPDA